MNAPAFAPWSVESPVENTAKRTRKPKYVTETVRKRLGIPKYANGICKNP